MTLGLTPPSPDLLPGQIQVHQSRPNFFPLILKFNILKSPRTDAVNGNVLQKKEIKWKY